EREDDQGEDAGRRRAARHTQHRLRAVDRVVPAAGVESDAGSVREEVQPIELQAMVAAVLKARSEMAVGDHVVPGCGCSPEKVVVDAPDLIDQARRAGGRQSVFEACRPFWSSGEHLGRSEEHTSELQSLAY